MTSGAGSGAGTTSSRSSSPSSASDSASAAVNGFVIEAIRSVAPGSSGRAATAVRHAVRAHVRVPSASTPTTAPGTCQRSSDARTSRSRPRPKPAPLLP